MYSFCMQCGAQVDVPDLDFPAMCAVCDANNRARSAAELAVAEFIEDVVDAAATAVLFEEDEGIF